MFLARTVLIFLLAAPSWAAEDVAAALDAAWPRLDSPNAAVREAARRVVEAQPFETWKARALEEKATWASLELLRALAERCPSKEAANLSPHLCEQITTLRIEQMDEAQLVAAQRLTRFVFEKLGPLTEDELRQMLDLWTGLPVPASKSAARDRAQLIEFLRTAQPRRP